MRTRRYWPYLLIFALILMAKPTSTRIVRGQEASSWPDMLIRVWDGTQWQFQRVSSDGTAIDLLENAPDFIYINFLTYSPDHQWLYFSGTLNEDNPPSGEPTSIEGLPARIYRIPITGGQPQAIIDKPVEGGRICGYGGNCWGGPQMTPDGQYFVYMPKRDLDTGWQGIWRIRTDGTDDGELTAGLEGLSIRPWYWVVSDDGALVYFDLVGGDGSIETRTDTIYRALIDGSAPPELVKQIGTTSWRIAGDWLLTSRMFDLTLYQLSLTDDSGTILWHDPVTSVEVYDAYPEEDVIITVTASATEGRTLLRGLRQNDGELLWQMEGDIQAVIDNEWVLIKSLRFDQPTPLIRLRLDGSEQTELTGGHFPFVGRPVIAGEWLVAGSGSDLNTFIGAVNWTTGEERLFWKTDTPDTFIAYPLAASPDGNWIVFEVYVRQPDSRILSQIMIMPLAGGAPARVVKDGIYELNAFSGWMPE